MDASDFESKIADQQRPIEALTAGLQKVSTQLEARNLRRKWSAIPKAAGPLGLSH